MQILVSGEWGVDEAQAWLRYLQAAMPEATWLLDDPALDPAARARVEAAVVANPPAGRLQGLPQLRLIQSLWAGVDRLLADTTLPAEVPVARMVDPAMTAAMAETALWAALSLHRGFFQYVQQQAQARWAALPQRRADEWKITVLGVGQLGLSVARRLAQQGYPVRGWRQREGSPVPDLPCAIGPEALPPLLAQTDCLINLLPLTPSTRGLINAERLAQLPAGATVVNLARGAHVVEPDLLAALDSGHVAHAVLDVFSTEPLPPSHPFWRHPQVTVLPHAAALTDPRSAADRVAANLQALRDGLPLAHLVDRQRGY